MNENRSLRRKARLCGAVFLFAMTAQCSSPAPIERLTVVNETPFDVYVHVSDEERKGWTVLGKVQHGESMTNELVADQGATWTFRFQYGGEEAGELTVERAELRRNRWRVEVPASVAERLRDAGIDPPP